MFKIACLACALGAGLSGCATLPAGSSRSPIEAHVTDFQRTVTEGAVAGAIAGGLIGLVASGGDPRRMGQNIATGAVAGGLIGGGVGYVVAGKKQDFARQEDALNALVGDGRDRVARLSRLVVATQQVIDQRRRELNRIKSLQQGSTQRLSAQKAHLANVDADRLAVSKGVAAAEAEHTELVQNIQQYRARFPGAAGGELDGLVGQYEGQKKRLIQTPDELNRQIIDLTKVG